MTIELLCRFQVNLNRLDRLLRHDLRSDHASDFFDQMQIADQVEEASVLACRFGAGDLIEPTTSYNDATGGIGGRRPACWHGSKRKCGRQPWTFTKWPRSWAALSEPCGDLKPRG